MKTDIPNFLNELIEAQNQYLAVLHKQQKVLIRPTREEIASISGEEEKAREQLQKMLARKEELLTAARLQNIQSDSIEQLCEHFFPHNVSVQKLLNEVRSRSQQMQLLAYTNWTINRKSAIHVSQILELLETRGQGKTTYNQRSKADTSGGLQVDRVA